jgi:hypothetical protein
MLALDFSPPTCSTALLLDLKVPPHIVRDIVEMAAGLTSRRSAAIYTCPRLAVGDRNLPPVLARIWHDGHGPALVFSRPSIAAGTIER